MRGLKLSNFFGLTSFSVKVRVNPSSLCSAEQVQTGTPRLVRCLACWQLLLQYTTFRQPAHRWKAGSDSGRWARQLARVIEADESVLVVGVVNDPG